jgi:UDP-N-acetylmuramate dehydrogenase
LAAALAPLDGRGVLHRDAPLAARCTYRVGGVASLLAEVAEERDLEEIADALARLDGEMPVLVVGRGSNLLVADRGFRGLALVLGPTFERIVVEGAIVDAGASVALPVLARRSVAEGLTGFEWAVGVPGSLGGAVRMNAGGHGADLAASLESIRRLDLSTGEHVRVPAAALDLGYRRSNVAPHHVVTSARLVLAPGDRAAGEAALGEIVRWRREHQPGGANAGSVFTNPVGDSAGRLIDASGLKGLRVGSASVSAKHANFIQVDESGSADDVAELMRSIVQRVEDSTGVHLHAETRMVGFPGTLGGPP